jgi:hypothetical protein
VLDGSCRVSSSLYSAASRYLRQLISESQFRSEGKSVKRAYQLVFVFKLFILGHVIVLDQRVELSLPWASKEHVRMFSFSFLHVTLLVMVSCSVSDPDPHGSAFQLVAWIRIRNADPDLGGLKRAKMKREKKRS